MSMTPRERVHAVLAGERPDRPAVDMGGRVASFNKLPYLALKAHLGFGDALSGEVVTCFNTIEQFDERILQRFEVPFRHLYLRSASNFESVVEEGGSFHDEWGVRHRFSGIYYDRLTFPLVDATLDDLENFAWPDPYDAGRVAGLEEEARRLYEETEYSIAAGAISGGIQDECWNLRGMAQFMEDMLIDRDFAEALLDRILAIHTGMWENFLDAVGDYVDVVEIADDLGGQNGLLISPSLYRDLLKPRHAALIQAIRVRTKAKIKYHSDGAIMPLISDLIDIGVDILNPIQPLPGLMDPEEFKARFGGRLRFHGGVDVQSLLLNGTPEQVRRSVRHYLDVLGSESYFMAPANAVQPGTPPENVVAAYDEAARWRPA